jgi:hypothetical protein
LKELVSRYVWSASHYRTKAAPALYGKLAITHIAQRTTVRKRTTLGSVMATAAHRGHTFSSQPLPQLNASLFSHCIMKCRLLSLECYIGFFTIKTDIHQGDNI